MKRTFDVCVATALLVLMSPFLILVAISVKLDSKGPVFFRQQRVGRFGRIFRIHKFRTMKVNASGSMVTTLRDPRVTRLGGLLRQTKLDELPQLIDVIAGSMSLVGPRPEVPKYVAMWPDDVRSVILGVRPGITDPATLLLRDEARLLSDQADPEHYYEEVLLPAKTAAYLHYVQARTFLGDIGVLCHTASALLTLRHRTDQSAP